MAKMSGSVVHDIRNNLTVISSAVQLIQLKSNIGNDDLNSKLTLILDQIDSIMSQIDVIGQFSDRAKGSINNIHPNESCNNVLDVLKRKITKSGLTVRTNLSDDQRSLRTDVGLFEFLLLEMIESCLPPEKCEMGLSIQSSKTESMYTVNVSIEKTFDGFLSDSDRVDIMKLSADHLGAELISLPDSTGWNLSLPWGLDDST